MGLLVSSRDRAEILTMTVETLKLATRCILAIGATVTIAALAYAAGSPAAIISGFTIWALLPYVLLFYASRMAQTSGVARGILIVTLLSVAAANLIYVRALFVEVSSTSPLVFVLIPLYQLIVAAITLGVAYALRGRSAVPPL